MAEIKIKRSNVEGKIPLTTDLQLGELAINTYDGKLFLKRNNGLSDYIVEVGGNQGFEVKNQTGSTLTKGTLVKFAGTLGSSGKLLAAPFLANGSDPSDYFMGVVLDDIANGLDGFVIDHGKIYHINTAAYSEGAILYASATTAGAFTSTRPAAPNNKITVAAVVNSHASAGVLEVRVTLGSQLGNDELVELGTLSSGDILSYSSTSQRFENTALKTINGTSLLGSGNIVISGGESSPWAKKTANYTAVSGDKILADTTAGTFTVTLPASPVLGDNVIIADAGSWQTTNLTVARNASTIEGAAENLVLDIPNIQVEFVYDGATWEVYAFTGPSGVDVSDDTATNATVYPSWVSTTTGNQAVKTSSTKLYFNPSTGQFNATDFNSLSDANKKKDIQTIESAVGIVAQLRGVTFNWRDTDQAAIGVIAQEVESVLPQVVSTATTGEKSVSYGNIVAVLIEAVKEQQQEINALKQKLGV